MNIHIQILVDIHNCYNTKGNFRVDSFFEAIILTMYH